MSTSVIMVRCSWCHATPGEACRHTVTGAPLRHIPYHPCRYDDAGETMPLPNLDKVVTVDEKTATTSSPINKEDLLNSWDASTGAASNAENATESTAKHASSDEPSANESSASGKDDRTVIDE